MKKIIGLFSFTLLIVFSSCVSLGVSTLGANYFNNKQEVALVKYFKYEGESVSTGQEFDKALYFSNKITTVYMDKTTVQKFKNKKSTQLLKFSFYELYDGCLIYEGTEHLSDVYKTQAHPNGTVTKTLDRTHKNDNQSIKQKMDDFNRQVKQLNAVQKINDDTMFSKTQVGNTYYVFDIYTHPFNYSDNDGNWKSQECRYTLTKVDVFEDSKSITETHIAYIYNDREKQYRDEKGNPISKADALANEESYNAKGFQKRKNNKGLALTAYIKDGLVVKTETAE